MKRLKRVFAGLVAVAALGIVAIAILFAALRIETRSATELPAPTGSFAVGRAIFDWRDPTHEVLAWIWCPAIAGPASAPDDYIPAPMLAALGPPAFPFSYVYRERSRVRAHSLRDADMARQSFPIVIFRGGASKAVSDYTTLAEDLASHGYVVVGIDAPRRTGIVAFPDGRVVRRADENDVEGYEGQEQVKVAGRLLTAWTSDMAFALDRLSELNVSDPSGRFTGRFDMTRVGAFGHSFGGAQAAQFCRDDARCKAAIDIDGRPFGSVIQEGMPKPLMFLMSRLRRTGGAGDGASDPEIRQVAADLKSVYDRLPPATRQWAFIEGANHFTYSDDGGVLASHLVLGALRRLGILALDGRRQIAVATYAVHTFFDAHLRGQGVARLALSSPLYPELEVGDPPDVK